MNSIEWSTAPEGAEFYNEDEGTFYKFTNGKLEYLCSATNDWQPSGYGRGEFFGMNGTKANPLLESWPTEDRIDVIGTNGATGEHYTKSATDYLSQGMKILSERGNEYSATGEERSFPQVAQAFTAITGRQLSGSDVCLILNLVKKVRQYAQPNRLHEDSLVDAVNYDALWCQELAKELSE